MLLRGELDVAGVPAVTRALQGFRERGMHVVLDLEGLAFIDMSGMRMVLEAADDAARDGWSLAVTPGSPAVRRLVDLLDAGTRPPFDGSTR